MKYRPNFKKIFPIRQISSLFKIKTKSSDKFKIRDAEFLETINQFIQNAAQNMEKLHKDTLQHTIDEIADYVEEAHLDEHSVSKEYSKNLKNLIQ